MPGAGRLVLHFQTHDVPMAIGTSTMRRNYNCKMSGRHAAPIAQFFQVFWYMSMLHDVNKPLLA